MTTINYINRLIGGKYKILGLIGKGGMGTVYLGIHEVIGRRVAVKFLHAELALKKAFLERFYREARAAVSIGHPNVIDILDMGISDENEPYLVMEYLEGESLADMIERCGPLPFTAAADIIEPTLLALSAAHAKGIIHRDLKPENIFLIHHENAPPTVKLIDFGISKFTSTTDATKLTQTGSLIGSPAYMSPEQVQGKQTLDNRTDLYSVGVICYQLLAGKLPFSAPHTHALLLRILTDPPIPLRVHCPDLPEAVESFVEKLLVKDPDDRFETADEVLAALKSFPQTEDREHHLSAYTSGVRVKTIAGSPVEEVMEEASATLEPLDPASALTSSAWIGTLAPKKKWTKIGMAAFAGIVLLFIVGLLLSSPASEPAVSKPSPGQTADPKILRPTRPSALPESETVRITVTNLPAEAAIFLDNLPVPRNPFTVTASKRMLKLKVTAPGHAAFKTWIVPDSDQQIEADLGPSQISAAVDTSAADPIDTQPEPDLPLRPASATLPETAKTASPTHPNQRTKPASSSAALAPPRKKIKTSEGDIKYIGKFDE